MNRGAPTIKANAAGKGRQSPPSAAPRCQVGFSLIETMIVVAIISVLAAIAYPSYISHITKANRVAAEGCLSQVANYMQRYYATNLAYDKDSAGNANTLPALDCLSNQQTGAHYGYSLTTPNATQFTVQAQPTGTQATRDTACGTLTLDQTGTRDFNGTGTQATCW